MPPVPPARGRAETASGDPPGPPGGDGQARGGTAPGRQPRADRRRQPDPAWDRHRVAFRVRGEFIPGYRTGAAGPATATIEPRDGLYGRGGSSRRLRPSVREEPRRRRPSATPEAADVAGWCGDEYGGEEEAGDAAAWCGPEYR